MTNSYIFVVSCREFKPFDYKGFTGVMIGKFAVYWVLVTKLPRAINYE